MPRSQRPVTSSQTPQNGTPDENNKSYAHLGAATLFRSSRDLQFTPAEVSELQLRSLPSHSIGPLSLNIETPTGSYQSCEQNKESPPRTVASVGGSLPSQSPTSRGIMHVLADTSPDKTQANMPVAKMSPHSSAFEHIQTVSALYAYSQPAGGPALSSCSSLRAFAAASESTTPNPTSSGASLSTSHQGSIREEGLYEDPLCMPLPPGAGTVRPHYKPGVCEAANGRPISPLASPSRGQVHGVHGTVRHYTSYRSGSHVVAPTSASAATTAAVTASPWQTQRRVSPVLFVKEPRVSSISSQDCQCCPQRASGAYVRSIQSLQSDRSTSEGCPLHSGMQVMLTEELSLPGVPIYQSSSLGTSCKTANVVSCLHCITPNTGSKSSDSHSKLPGYSQQDSTATSGVMGQQTAPQTQTPAPSTPPSNTNARLSPKCMSNRFEDASERSYVSQDTQEHSLAAPAEGESETRPTIRGGRHAYMSNPAPSAQDMRPIADSNHEEDSEHSPTAQLDVSFVFADSDCTDVGVDGPMDDAACQQDMAKAVGNRVQQFLSSDNVCSAQTAQDHQDPSSSRPESPGNWGVSDRSRPRSSSIRTQQAPTATRSSPGRIRHSMAPAAMHSDIESDRSVRSSTGTTKVATGGHIQSFPLITNTSQHPAEATRADVSPASHSNSARSSHEAAKVGSGRHMYTGDRHHMAPHSSNDREHGTSIDHHADGDRALRNLEAVRSSVSPRRSSGHGAHHGAQHASYGRTTPPQSLDRKASTSSNQSFAACTMDALVAHQTSSMMSSYKLPAPGSNQSRTGLPPSGAYSAVPPRSRSRHDQPGANAYVAAAPHSSSQPRDYSAEYYANGAGGQGRNPASGMDTIESQKSTRSQRLHAPRPKPSDNLPASITPHMLNAAFSSAPNITLDMIAAKSRAAALRPEDSIMSEAAFDSVMTTRSSIGGVLRNHVDHAESARLENAPQNPFRDTMDSINSQVRPPRLGGNELFNSHLRSFRETLAMAGRPFSTSSSTAQAANSEKERSNQPMRPASLGGGTAGPSSSGTQHPGSGPVRKLDMHSVQRSSDQSSTDPHQRSGGEPRGEVRSRHPTPPHAALRTSSRGSDAGSSQTHMHAQPKPSLRYQSRLEPQSLGSGSSQSQSQSQAQARPPAHVSSRAPAQQHRAHGETERNTHTSRNSRGHSSRNRRIQFPRRNVNSRRLHPSAISKLQESLRRGTHEEDEVVPVHLYLPPIKLKRVRGSLAPQPVPMVQPTIPQPKRATPPPQQLGSVRSLEGQASHAHSTPPTFPAGNHSPVTPTQELGDTHTSKERSQWLSDNSNRTSGPKAAQQGLRTSSAATRDVANAQAPKAAAAAAADAGSGGAAGAAAAAAARIKVQNPQYHTSISKRSMLTGSLAQSWLSCFVPIRPMDDDSDRDSCCGSDIADAGAQAAADIKHDAPPPCSKRTKKSDTSKSRGWLSLMRSTGSSHSRPTHHNQHSSLQAPQMRTMPSQEPTNASAAEAAAAAAAANLRSGSSHRTSTHKPASEAAPVRQLSAEELRVGMRMSCI